MNDSSDALAELLTLTVTVDKLGTRIYRNSHDQIHRRLGPAIEYPDGTRMWYLDGQRHRTTGPAIEYTNGDKAWFLDGLRHRTDGPAIERADGTRRWCLNGEHLTEKEFHDNLK